jgi:hypothetical protein
VTGSAAAILIRLASTVGSEQLATDLSAGRLDGAIGSLSNHDLTETVEDLRRRKEGLMKHSGDQVAVQVVDLVRDRVLAEQRVRELGS